MKKVLAFSLSILPAFMVTSVAFAQEPNLNYFETLVTEVGDIVGALIPVIIGIGMVVILWGLVVFATSAGDPDKRQSGIQTMIWGVVILFVMVALWGLVELVETLTGVNSGTGAPTGPDVPNGGGDGGSEPTPREL